MSDLLMHYTISYLVANRVLKPRHALLVALVELPPDIDALREVEKPVKTIVKRPRGDTKSCS